MPLDILKVHEYTRHEGSNRMVLVKANPYTRMVKEGDTPVLVQKGRFYSDGGASMDHADVPSWARKRINESWTPAARKEVGLPPEGVNWSGDEPFPEGLDQNLINSEAGAVMTIAQAVYALDEDNDDHWTNEGKPAIDAVRDLTKSPRYISRNNIEEAAPGYRRPNLTED